MALITMSFNIFRGIMIIPNRFSGINSANKSAKLNGFFTIKLHVSSCKYPKFSAPACRNVI